MQSQKPSQRHGFNWISSSVGRGLLLRVYIPLFVGKMFSSMGLWGTRPIQPHPGKSHLCPPYLTQTVRMKSSCPFTYSTHPLNGEDSLAKHNDHTDEERSQAAHVGCQFRIQPPCFPFLDYFLYIRTLHLLFRILRPLVLQSLDDFNVSYPSLTKRSASLDTSNTLNYCQNKGCLFILTESG